jgi:glutamyl-Q tRNA(Asp) synthetase
LPLAMNDQGQKLSKQNMAHALDITQAPQLLQQALQALHQPSVDLDRPTLMLEQAVQQWDLALIPKTPELQGHYL